MSKDKEEKVTEKEDLPADEAERTDAEKKDEDDVEGHVSAADVWAPGATTNKWKRRR